MTTGEVIAATIMIASMVGSLVAIYVSHEKKMATNTARINYLENDLSKLQVRVGDLEDKLVIKVDQIMEKLNKIEIQLAKK